MTAWHPKAFNSCGAERLGETGSQRTNKMRKLLDLTRLLAKDNPGQEFFIDFDKAVSAARNPKTGEIIPILSGLIDGNVAAYHGVLTDGKPPTYTWRSLECFSTRFDSIESVDKAMRRGCKPDET